MPINRVAGSFRDPSGFVFQRSDEIYRQVNPSYREHYDRLLSSGLYAAATEQGLLVSHEEVEDPDCQGAYKVLAPRRIPFVSYPYEWCFSQLKDAALLTLQLQALALRHGMTLKDASAYNVQFLEGRPVFIDTLSFEVYEEGRPWVGYQQFCRHFLAPLALLAHCHVDLRKLLSANIDGIPLELASRLLPARTRLRFSLLAHIHLHARAERKHASRPGTAARADTAVVTRGGLDGLIASLAAAVQKLDWKPAGTEWGDYYSDTKYSSRSLEHKRELVGRFVESRRPESVWDFGANTGLFSRIASARGVPTVAFDVDPAAVEKNYRACRREADDHLLPLLLDLANPSPALGWKNSERMSLFERGPVDTAFALALVHHLAIGNNLPLPDIADFFQRVCRQLVIEFVPKSDSQTQRLLGARDDIFPDYTEASFEAAFQPSFSRVSKTPIEDSQRVLYVFECRSPSASC